MSGCSVSCNQPGAYISLRWANSPTLLGNAAVRYRHGWSQSGVWAERELALTQAAHQKHSYFRLWPDLHSLHPDTLRAHTGPAWHAAQPTLGQEQYQRLGGRVQLRKTKETQAQGGIWEGWRQPWLVLTQVAYQQQSRFLSQAGLPKPAPRHKLSAHASPMAPALPPWCGGAGTWRGETYHKRDLTLRDSAAVTWDLPTSPDRAMTASEQRGSFGSHLAPAKPLHHQPHRLPRRQPPAHPEERHDLCSNRIQLLKPMGTHRLDREAPP